MENNEDRLTMRAAVSLLGIECDTRKSSTNITCPICAKNQRQKKLHIDFDKHNEGVFRCAKCGEFGGPIKFWGLMRNISDTKSAVKDYYSFIGLDNAIKTKAFNANKNKSNYQEPKIADIKTRNHTYSTLLDCLTLQKNHMENLLNRGLSKETIIRNGYKSVPQMHIEKIVSKLLMKGCILDGVAGFYKKDNKWNMQKYTSGYIIPQRNGFGEIEFCQIRFDNVIQDMPRYISLSSRDKDSGSPAYSFCHFSKGKNGIKEIILTEGALKADVITELTGYSVLSIAGVNSTKYLPKALLDLKEKGLEKICIAFDMDIKHNIYVKNAYDKITSLLTNVELPFSTLEWDDTYKGLDDFLFEKKKNV